MKNHEKKGGTLHNSFKITSGIINAITNLFKIVRRMQDFRNKVFRNTYYIIIIYNYFQYI
jgi:hypothetical protein